MDLQDPKIRESLRSAIELVSREAKPGESKWVPIMRAMFRESVLHWLSPLLPDPSGGTVQLAACMLPALARVLSDKFVDAPVLVPINDPDAATRERIDALDPGAPVPDELEPYVLAVPWDLYEAANERNMVQWVMKNTPMPSPTAEDDGGDDGA